jgi:hypothetical protein
MDADKNMEPIELDQAVASRRQAIRKFAAYTAPVLLAVLTSEKAMAVSVVDCLPPRWSPPKWASRGRGTE